MIIVVNLFLALIVNEIQNKTDHENIQIAPRYMNVEIKSKACSFISGNICVSNFRYSAEVTDFEDVEFSYQFTVHVSLYID